MVFTGRRFGGTPLTFFELNRTWPESGSTKPAMTLRVVVLPQPEAPSRVTNSPSRMERFSRSSTRSPSNSTTMSCNSMIFCCCIFASPLCGKRPRKQSVPRPALREPTPGLTVYPAKSFVTGPRRTPAYGFSYSKDRSTRAQEFVARRILKVRRKADPSVTVLVRNCLM